MSSYDPQNPLSAAKKAERDMHSHRAKYGHSDSDTTMESGVDASIENRFSGASVTYGSAASGAGGNREIPPSEGGEVDQRGQPSKARHFEGRGSPRAKMEEERNMKNK